MTGRKSGAIIGAKNDPPARTAGGLCTEARKVTSRKPPRPYIIAENGEKINHFFTFGKYFFTEVCDYESKQNKQKGNQKNPRKGY